jgi:hypothetical protein
MHSLRLHPQQWKILDRLDQSYHLHPESLSALLRHACADRSDLLELSDLGYLVGHLNPDARTRAAALTRASLANPDLWIWGTHHGRNANANLHPYRRILAHLHYNRCLAADKCARDCSANLDDLLAMDVSSHITAIDPANGRCRALAAIHTTLRPVATVTLTASGRTYLPH